MRLDNFTGRRYSLATFRNSVFNGTIASHLIEHLKDPKNIFKECFKICKGKARLVLLHFFHPSAYKSFFRRTYFS